MTYYTPKSRFTLPQTLITIMAIFCLFGWMQERDERAREVTALHQRLVSVTTECAPIIDLSMPVDWELIES
jgi:hypothetical protein